MPASFPKPWFPSQGPAPRVLGITLHRPWSWAFFHGGPGHWKDVENRKANFPAVPVGTWLAIHNGAKWDAAAESTIRLRLPSTRALTHADCPQGFVVGLVRVRDIIRGGRCLYSRWCLGWGTSIWLEDERLQLQQPIPCAPGWFGVWHLPPPVLAHLESLLPESGP